jgi:hypothetical protein
MVSPGKWLILYSSSVWITKNRIRLYCFEQKPGGFYWGVPALSLACFSSIQPFLQRCERLTVRSEYHLRFRRVIYELYVCTRFSGCLMDLGGPDWVMCFIRFDPWRENVFCFWEFELSCTVHWLPAFNASSFFFFCIRDFFIVPFACVSKEHIPAARPLPSAPTAILFSNFGRTRNPRGVCFNAI